MDGIKSFLIDYLKKKIELIILKERLMDSLGDCAGGVYLSTIHSFCVRFLREEIHQLHYPRNFTIVDSDDQKSILKEDKSLNKNNLNYQKLWQNTEEVVLTTRW